MIWRRLMRTILLLFLFSSSSFVILKATKAANSEAIDPSRNPGDNTGGGNKKLGNTKRPEWVPGCPDLESLEASSITQLTTKELQQLSCFCGPPGQEDNEVTNGAPVKPMPTAEDEVSIACIFGSTVADLERAMELVWKANKSVERILLDNIEFHNNRTLMSVLSKGDLKKMGQLEIRKCRRNEGTVLDMSEKELLPNRPVLFPSLKSMEINQCELEGMPSMVLVNAPNLSRLVLTDDKIKMVNRRDLEAQAKTLRHFDLSGNLLQSATIEPGSLSQLRGVRTLMFGEHNFAGKTFLEEVGNMPGLEELDLTRVDGIESMDQFKFARGNALKSLTLSGCNLKHLNKTSFAGLDMLETLDLRINLIVRLERGCFKGLDRLQFLALAGNFIRDIPAAVNGGGKEDHFWSDLPNLLTLDLGWNEFRQINRTTFEGISASLERLNLRSNEDLKEIEPESFSGMKELKFLNMSGTKLKRLGSKMINPPKLKELDISSSNIDKIDAEAFDAFKKSVEVLNLSKNKLRTLDNRLLEGTTSLSEIDLSENEWLCDTQMLEVVKTIEGMYENAKKNSLEFELKNNGLTTCDRPYSRRNQSIFELRNENNPSNLVYVESEDTTTATTAAVSPQQKTIKEVTDDIFGMLSNTSWSPLETFIGGGIDEHKNLLLNMSADGGEGGSLAEAVNDDSGKPRYDINKVQYGEKFGVNGSNTWVSGVVVTLLIIITAVCIILVVRRKNTEKEGENKGALDAREAMTAF